MQGSAISLARQNSMASSASPSSREWERSLHEHATGTPRRGCAADRGRCAAPHHGDAPHRRSEEHTSELQSQSNLVCRLLLEKKKKKMTQECSRRSHVSLVG